MNQNHTQPNTQPSQTTHHHPTQASALQVIENKPKTSSHSHNTSPYPKAHMGDTAYLGSVNVDRLEMVNVRDDFSATYDWQAWFGQDYDRLVVRAEGDIEQGRFKNARNEMLWGHALTAYWDTQIGLRYDSGLGNDRIWGAFGIQGFAPYWLYVEATAYVGEQGRTAFRLEMEYDLRITQKLILQPRTELNFYSQRDDSRFISSGLSAVEAGLRLRYEITRKIAPYIGIEWASTLGSAGNLLKARGNQADETRLVAGLHFWF